MNAKRAFTLIELLVVIAIIAILAAILFPVFAQAKAAAKKISSVSNMKQLLLAEIMYENDNDDVITPTTQWANNLADSDAALCFSSTNCFAPWTYLCLPYIKTGGLFLDPQAPAEANYFNNWTDTEWGYPDYGLNYSNLTPWFGSNPSQNKIATSIVRPAETVIFTNKWAEPEATFPGGDVFGFCFSYNCGGPILNYAIDGPNCYQIPAFCAVNWGTGSQYFTGNGGGPWFSTIASGVATGGDSIRAGNQQVTGFVDGHAKSLSPGGSAVGTNFNINSPGNQLVFTPANAATTNYLWSGQ